MGLFKLGRWRSAEAQVKQTRAESEADADRAAAAVEGGDWRPLLDAGRHARALRSVGSFDGEAVADAGLQLARALILRAWGREAEASQAVERAWDLGDRRPEMFALKGWSANRSGNAGVAADWYRRGRDAGDGSLQTALSLAAAWVSAGRLDDARELYSELRARAPDDVPVALASGICELRARRLDAAVAHFERATRMATASAAAWEHLGVALSAADRPDEALTALERSAAMAARAPVEAAPFVNRAIALCELGRPDEALPLLEEGLRERPEINGHLQLGVALLTTGRYADGWRQYEHRWLGEPLLGLRARYGVPQWSGQPLRGRTVLVRSEQGLGDVFQFARYLPMLKEEGARVLFQPLKGMDGIARRFPGVDVVVAEGERLPLFDYFANLMSLPAAFGTTVASIPREIPYLSPDPAYSSKWRSRFADRRAPSVGLAWAGRPQHRVDRHRSLALGQLGPLLAVPGVRFVSLQKGPAAVQAEAVPESVAWDGIGAELDDLDDAAAVLAELDLLVCVDTGLAHLAAAMGKDVWVMLPQPADYRWMTEREDTPWYPTMRLFRQRVRRDWTSVIDRVAAELSAWRSAWDSESKRELPAAVVAAPESPATQAASTDDGRGLAGIAAVAETFAGLLRFMPDADRCGRSLGHQGEWLQPQLDFLGRFVRPGMSLLETGAGVGAHAIPLARAVGYDGFMLLYEGRIPLRHLLVDNLALHGLPHACVIRRSLGRAIADGESSGHDTVDDLQLARLDGLKVNETGGAIDVIAGADETLWRCRPWVMMTDPEPGSLVALRDALVAHGYRIWRSEIPLFREANFNRRDRDISGGAAAMTLFALAEEVEAGNAPAGWSEWA